MVRRKQTFRRDDTTIQLIVMGHKTLLAENATIYATLEHTWIQVLKDELGLELDPKSGVFVCTNNYSFTVPQGWRAEITETVRQFVNKYERKKKYYTVRLCDPKITPFTPVTTNVQTPRRKVKRRTKTRRANTPAPASNNASAIGPQIVISTQGAQVVQQPTEGPYSRPRIVPVNKSKQQHYGTRLKRKSEETPVNSPSVSVRKQPRREAAQIALQNLIKTEPQEVEEVEVLEEETEQDANASFPVIESIEHVTPHHSQNFTTRAAVVELDDDDDDDFDDNLSLCTAVSQEEHELRGMGIRVEDTKSLVVNRIPRFSNAFFLRVKAEIQKLQRNNLWDRNVNRGPLGSYLLQELFRD